MYEIFHCLNFYIKIGCHIRRIEVFISTLQGRFSYRHEREESRSGYRAIQLVEWGFHIDMSEFKGAKITIHFAATNKTWVSSNELKELFILLQSIKLSGNGVNEAIWSFFGTFFFISFSKILMQKSNVNVNNCVKILTMWKLTTVSRY